MIMPRYMPPDAYFDDPATKIDPAPRDDSLAFALAGGGITRVQEWITRGRGRSQAAGPALRSRDPVHLPSSLAMQAPLRELVRETAWRFPAAGLASPARICP